jgi:beta-glucanase (GH16 family)
LAKGIRRRKTSRYSPDSRLGFRHFFIDKYAHLKETSSLIKTTLETDLRISCRILALLVLSFGGSFTHAQCSGVSPSLTGSVTWTPQWYDEFSGAANSPIDSTKWTFDTGNLNVNNELEIYCDPSSNNAPCSSGSPNAFIDGNGHLAIQARSPSANTFTSARLKTEGLQTFNAGRIEASLQFPSHAGLWPAFWLLGSQPGVNWPTVGESDIMENWPTTSNISGPGATGNCSTVHTTVTSGNGKGKCFTFPSGQQVDTAFHIYGQIWSANMIQYYIDDPTQPYFVVTPSDLPAGDTWPFSSSANPFFIIMNVAVGGTLGAPVDNNTGTQNPLLADYVRQYTPSAVPAPQLTPSGNITLTAGATTANTTSINMTGTLGSGRVAFSCSTTAPKASCVVTSTDPVNNHTVDFTSSTSASVTVTATTTANTSRAALSSFGWTGLASAMALLLFVPVVKQRRREIWFGLGIFGLAFMVGMPGCGGRSGSGNNGGGGGGHSNGTTPGNYTITVNAYTVSSTDAATPSATANINLSVN